MAPGLGPGGLPYALAGTYMCWKLLFQRKLRLPVPTLQLLPTQRSAQSCLEEGCCFVLYGSSTSEAGCTLYRSCTGARLFRESKGGGGLLELESKGLSAVADSVRNLATIWRRGRAPTVRVSRHACCF